MGAHVCTAGVPILGAHHVPGAGEKQNQEREEGESSWEVTDGADKGWCAIINHFLAGM